jgi:hypothetical protein
LNRLAAPSLEESKAQDTMMEVFQQAFLTGNDMSGSEEFDDLEPDCDDSLLDTQYRTDSVFCIPSTTDKKQAGEEKELRKFETY